MTKSFGEKMTIDKLAIIIGKNFERMDDKFSHIDGRFDGLEKRLDKIENILLTDHIQRIERLEDKMTQVQVVIGKKFE